MADRTGLEGLYSFAMDFSAADAQAVDAANALPSFSTALPEQLGLKLQATNASLDVVVIDRVEKPTVD